MAMQDNITISSPSVTAESSRLRLVAKKNLKKQQEELLSLASLLKTLEKELKDTKAGAIEAGASVANSNEGPGDAAFGKAMAEMAYALQMLQVEIAKFGQKKAQYDNNISSAEVNLATNNLHKLEKEIRKIAKKKRDGKIVGILMKVADAFVAAVATIVAIATLQPELLIITAVSIASGSGLFKEATKGVTKLLELNGYPSKDAEMVASVLVCVLVVVAAASMGDPEQILGSAAETAEEIGTAAGDSAETVATQVGELTEEASEEGMMQKVGSFLKNANPFSRLSKSANMAIFAGMQTISQTGIIATIADEAMKACGTSKEKREKAEMAINIILAITALVVSIGAGAAAMEGAGAKVATNTTSSLTRKITSNAANLLTLGAFGEGAAGITSGTFQIQQGQFEGALGNIKADLELVNASINMSSDETAEDQNSQSTIIKGEKMGARTIANLMNGMAGFAELFTEDAPV